eukprot:gene13113-16949_t
MATSPPTEQKKCEEHSFLGQEECERHLCPGTDVKCQYSPRGQCDCPTVQPSTAPPTEQKKCEEYSFLGQKECERHLCPGTDVKCQYSPRG